MSRSQRLFLRTTLVLLCSLCAFSYADQAKRKSKGTANEKIVTGTLAGKVIDIACYAIDHGTGPEHQACALGGVPIGILDDQKRIWLAINKNFGSARDLLIPYIGKTVSIEGWMASKGEAHVISISKIGPVDHAESKKKKSSLK